VPVTRAGPGLDLPTLETGAIVTLAQAVEIAEALTVAAEMG